MTSTNKRNNIKITRHGQCWMRVDKKHAEQLKADGLLSEKMFDQKFSETKDHLETSIQSGFPAKAEKLGYNVIWD